MYAQKNYAWPYGAIDLHCTRALADCAVHIAPSQLLCRTHASLREGCAAILRSDCRQLTARLYAAARAAPAQVYVHATHSLQVASAAPVSGLGLTPAAGGQWFK